MEGRSAVSTAAISSATDVRTPLSDTISEYNALVRRYGDAVALFEEGEALEACGLLEVVRAVGEIAGVMLSAIGRKTDIPTVKTVTLADIAAILRHLCVPCSDTRLYAWMSCIPKGHCHELADGKVTDAQGVQFVLMCSLHLQGSLTPAERTMDAHAGNKSPLDVYISLGKQSHLRPTIPHIHFNERIVGTFGNVMVDTVGVQAMLAEYNQRLAFEEVCTVMRCAQLPANTSDTKQMTAWRTELRSIIRHALGMRTRPERVATAFTSIFRPKGGDAKIEYDPAATLSFDELMELHTLLLAIRSASSGSHQALLQYSSIVDKSLNCFSVVSAVMHQVEALPSFETAAKRRVRAVNDRLRAMEPNSGGAPPAVRTKLEARMHRITVQTAQTGALLSRQSRTAAATAKELSKTADAQADAVTQKGKEHSQRMEEARETAEEQLAHFTAHMQHMSETIDFSFMNLATVPTSLYEVEMGQHRLQSVLRLTFAGNQLERIPGTDFLGHLQTIQELDLEGNRLTTLPTALADLHTLQVLRLAKNHLRIVPDCVMSLASLRVLDVSKCALSALPEALIFLRNLQIIRCSGNSLAELPSHMSSMVSLKELDCASNQIRDVSPALSLPGLQVLKASSNSINALPGRDSIKSLSLMLVDLSNNGLQRIDGLQLLSELRSLDLSSNRIRGVPADGIAWSKLGKLNLRDNKIMELHEDILNEMSSLQWLDVSRNKLQSLPATIHNCFLLRDLILDFNEIAVLPAAIGACKMLTRLQLSHNLLGRDSICGLPGKIAALPLLAHVDISYNALTVLPRSLAKCSKLMSVDASNNHISELHDAELRSKSITTLILSNNRLLSIDCNIGTLMSKLEILDVSCNELERLPDTLGLCPLKVLKASSNRLVNVPTTLGVVMDSIEVFDVVDNPMAELPTTLPWNAPAINPDTAGPTPGPKMSLPELPHSHGRSGWHDGSLDAPGSLLEEIVSDVARSLHRRDADSPFLDRPSLNTEDCPQELDGYMRWAEARSKALKIIVLSQTAEYDLSEQSLEQPTSLTGAIGGLRLYKSGERAFAGLLADVEKVVHDTRVAAPVEIAPSIAATSSLDTLASSMERWTAAGPQSESRQREVEPAAQVSSQRADALAQIKPFVDSDKLALIFRDTEYSIDGDADVEVVGRSNPSLPRFGMGRPSALAAPSGAAGSVAVVLHSQSAARAHDTRITRSTSVADAMNKLDLITSPTSRRHRHVSRVPLREAQLNKYNVESGTAPRGQKRLSTSYSQSDIARYAAFVSAFASHAEEEWWKYGGNYLTGKWCASDFLNAVAKRIIAAHATPVVGLAPISEYAPNESVMSESGGFSKYPSIMEFSRPPTAGPPIPRSLRDVSTNDSGLRERSTIARSMRYTGGVDGSSAADASLMLAALSKSGHHPAWNDHMLQLLHHYYFRAHDYGAVPWFGSLDEAATKTRQAGRRIVQEYRQALADTRSVLRARGVAADKSSKSVASIEDIRQAAVSVADQLARRKMIAESARKAAAESEARMLNVFVGRRARELRDLDQLRNAEKAAQDKMNAAVLSEYVRQRSEELAHVEHKQVYAAGFNPVVATTKHFRHSLQAIQAAAVERISTS